jgi:hypothetical protein
VQYPKATFRKTGQRAHGITAVDDGKGKLTSSTGGNTVRDAVLNSGRVDKRPAAKAERAKEATENKAAKKKNRDPFTREHTEWWVDMWRLDERAGGPASPAGRENANKQAAQNQQNMQAKRRDPGAANPRGVSSGPTQAMKDSAARERNASRITKPAVRQSPTVTSKGSRLGGQKQTMKTTPVSSPSTIKSPAKKETEAKKPVGTSSPATPYKPPAITDKTRKRKVDTQMRNLGKDRASVTGQMKQVAGGDMFIKDKKTDTKDTRDRKASMRSKARGDFAKKKVQQTGNFIKGGFKGPEQTSDPENNTVTTNTQMKSYGKT